MLTIRLARTGRKKSPSYRLVLQEKDWAPKSKALEILGHMDPKTNPATVQFNTERVQYWLGQGAQPSTTVHNMFVTAGLISGKKKRSVFGQKEATADASATAETPSAESAPAAESPEKTEEKSAE